MSSEDKPSVPTTEWPTTGVVDRPAAAVPAVPFQQQGRVGVVLMHRGDPSSTADAKGWVRRWYADPSAFSVPFGSEAQGLFANLFSRFDTRGVGKRMAELGGTSPMHAQSIELASQLQRRLNGETEGTAAATFAVRHATLYGEPTVAQTLQGFRADGITRVVAISLYPQRADRFVKPMQRALDQAGDGLEISFIDRYPTSAGYLVALRSTITAALFRAPDSTVVFCALAIDRKDEQAGDPYPDQLKLTTAAVMEGVEAKSKVSWLDTGAPGMPTDMVLERLRDEKVDGVVLVPLGTAVDELDVVHALDVRLRPFARDRGFARVERARAVALEPAFLDMLQAELTAHLQRVSTLGFAR